MSQFIEYTLKAPPWSPFCYKLPPWCKPPHVFKQPTHIWGGVIGRNISRIDRHNLLHAQLRRLFAPTTVFMEIFWRTIQVQAKFGLLFNTIYPHHTQHCKSRWDTINIGKWHRFSCIIPQWTSTWIIPNWIVIQQKWNQIPKRKSCVPSYNV